MARSPYAIRKGFEYQDLVCLCALLELLETEPLDLQFEIESDKVDHVDDLVVYTSPTFVIARQIKFHVDQEYAESFETLTYKKTKTSRSLIEKLFAGWKSLRSNGINEIRIEFISSNPAERGRFKLGPVIETASGGFRDKFFDHNDFSKWLTKFKSLLNVDDAELREFLDSVEWKLGFESIEGLRRKASHLLKRLHLPFDDDAVSRILELVGELANTVTGRMTLRSFIELLWKNSRFRDACEQRFSIDFGTSQQRRANKIRIAVISLETIPAFIGSKYACLEEPLPFSDYHKAVTASDKEGLLDQNRASWKKEYIEWTTERIDTLLAFLAKTSVDILVFPRLSLPLPVAAIVAEWAKSRNITSVIGGHSLPLSQRDRSLLQSSLNVTVGTPDADVTSPSDLVVDCITRHNRAGRGTLAQLESPYSKSEILLTQIEPIFIETCDGWLSALIVPSQSAANAVTSGGITRQELVVVSASVHISEPLDTLSSCSALVGTPVVYASQSVNVRPGAGIIDGNSIQPRHDDAWEGVQFHTITYERSHSGWNASIELGETIPLVYFPSDKTLDGTNFQDLRGLSSSRNDAIASLQQGKVESFVLSTVESPSEFFFRRAKEADAAIREKLSEASPQQLELFSKTLALIATEGESLRKKALLPPQFSPPPQKLLPQRVTQFFNRSKEKSRIGQLLSAQSDITTLLLYGPPGIGKRELLLESQRVASQPKSWVRFRCVPQSRLEEVFAQLLVRLGENAEVPKEIDSQLFARVVDAAKRNGVNVLIFEDAHFLPIFRDHQDHAQLLAFLTHICSSTHFMPKVIFVSNHKGHLQFSGSHRMDVFHLPGLEAEYVIEIIQEHLLTTSTKYEPPSVDEMSTLASRIYGHPFMAKLAAVVLEESSFEEVIEKLYSRVETKEFVLGRLLNGITLTVDERSFLHFASLLRIPVSSDAFVHFGGTAVLTLLDDLPDRCLMLLEDGRYRLHPLLSEYFQASLRENDAGKSLHTLAYSYFESLSKKRKLTVEEQTELVFHGVSSGRSIDLADLQMFAGSIRTALTDAVKIRDWASVENAARQLNCIWPYDVSGQIGMALALDNSGSVTARPSLCV